MVDYIKPSDQPYPSFDTVGRGLRGARDWMNNASVPQQVPFIGGLGAGDAIIGQAPEELQQWSYGNVPYQMTPQGVRLPQIKKDRADGVMSTVFLGDTAGSLGLAAGRGLSAGARNATNAALGAGEDAGRRDFMKKAGLAAAAVAAPTAAVKLAQGVEAAGVKKAVAGMTRGAAESTAAAATRVSPAAYFEGLNRLMARHDRVHAKASERLSRQTDSVFKREYESWRAKQTPQNLAEHDSIVAGGHPEFDGIHPWDTFSEEEIATHLPRTGRLHDKRVDLEDGRFGARITRLENYKNLPQHGPGGGYEPVDDMYHRLTGEGVDRAEALAATEKYRRSLGILSDKEAEAVVRGGGKHVDPETGLHAVIDHNDNLSWFSPRTGQTAAQKHWVNDDWTKPSTKVYNPADEAAQRASMFNIGPGL